MLKKNRYLLNPLHHRLFQPPSRHLWTVLIKRSLSSLNMTLLVTSLSSTVALAKEPVVQTGIAPSHNQWASFKPKSETNSALTLSETEMRDPQKLLAFLKDRPEALDPTRMTPFIAVEVGQTLLYGGEVRKALTLLDKARDKWPGQPQLLQTWTRALVKLGSPSYARVGIERWREANPDASVSGYTQYLYALCVYLEGPKDPQHLNQTIQLVTKLLESEPSYQGPDGVNASQLRSFIEEMRGRLKPSR